MENNEEIQGEGNRLLGDEPGDPGAPWLAMIRPHSAHNTHCWDSDSGIGCHLKTHLSPHRGTLPTSQKMIIFTETLLSVENYTHISLSKQRDKEKDENEEGAHF